MTIYDVIEVTDDRWQLTPSGWIFRFNVLASLLSLHEAQSVHANLIHTHGDVLTENGWHKYAIIQRESPWKQY